MAKWQKGQSGNPSGKPKDALGASLTAALRRKAVEIDPYRHCPNVEVWAEALNRACKRGQPKALEMAFERLDGKVPQQLNVDAKFTREERLGKLQELLTDLSASEYGHSDPSDPSIN